MACTTRLVHLDAHSQDEIATDAQDSQYRTEHDEINVELCVRHVELFEDILRILELHALHHVGRVQFFIAVQVLTVDTVQVGTVHRLKNTLERISGHNEKDRALHK